MKKRLVLIFSFLIALALATNLLQLIMGWGDESVSKWAWALGISMNMVVLLYGTLVVERSESYLLTIAFVASIIAIGSVVTWLYGLLAGNYSVQTYGVCLFVAGLGIGDRALLARKTAASSKSADVVILAERMGKKKNRR